MAKISKTILLSSTIFALLFPVAPSTHAQTPLVVYFSFEAQNYAPPEYLAGARTLPVPGSTILISANPFSKRTGGVLTVLDPKQYLFRWFFGATKIAEGRGLNEVSYNVPDGTSPNQSLLFRLELASLSSDEVLASPSLTIPLATPKVVLYRMENGKPVLSGQSEFLGARGSSITLLAKPYFFNAGSTSLEFQWFAAGELITGPTSQPHIFNVKLPAALVSQNFSLRARNSQNPSEQAALDFVVKSY